MDQLNPDWMDDWTEMTSVDWGHASLCLLLSIAEIAHSGFIVFLKKEGGGETYGEGSEKFR